MRRISRSNYSISYRGFTVVELAIVVSIIGILASVSAVGWGAWQQSLANKQMQSDLRLAASAMQNAKNTGSGYPTSIPSTFSGGSKGLTLTWRSGDSTKYCIDVSSNATSNKYYITESKSDPVAGDCSAVSGGGGGGSSVPTPTTPSVRYSSTKKPTGYVLYVNASGGVCTTGSTEWKILIQTTATPNWGAASWQVPDYKSESGAMITGRYIFAKPRCTDGTNSVEGSVASTFFPGTPNSY